MDDYSLVSVAKVVAWVILAILIIVFVLPIFIFVILFVIVLVVGIVSGKDLLSSFPQLQRKEGYLRPFCMRSFSSSFY
jgi:hypothetical protein